IVLFPHLHYELILRVLFLVLNLFLFFIDYLPRSFMVLRPRRLGGITSSLSLERAVSAIWFTLS
ncbi:MAG: hypothetical protein LBO67_03350, partial [Spirochaetaceae bacterium]|nr:hypothetical protein [Spirochaetaceae bacterium]